MVATMVGLILFICFMERATRRLLIQYPKRASANGMMQADRSHLPLKLLTGSATAQAARRARDLADQALSDLMDVERTR